MTRIGHGFFGEVSKALFHGAPVAVKKTAITASDESSLEREKTLLGSILPHPNVVRVLGVCSDAPSGVMMLIMEFCAAGSVKDYLAKAPKVSF